MCISAKPAEFTGTKGYIGEALYQGQLVHVMGYQNEAKNLIAGANALILPIPSKTPITKENVLDLGDKGKNLLNRLTSDYFLPRENSRGITLNAVTKSVRMFKSGIYDIVVSEKPSLIFEALKSVHEEKRPDISAELLQWYEDFYPGWSIAVCCFNTQEKVESAPMFWWYPPKDETNLFFPGMDGHKGSVPDLNSLVKVDHKIILGSQWFEEKGSAQPLRDGYYDQMVDSDLRPLFSSKILGRRFWGKLKNGDFKISAESLRKHQRQDLLRVQKDTPVEATESETHMGLMDQFEGPKEDDFTLGGFLSGIGKLPK